jgi:hypothetical protein
VRPTLSSSGTQSEISAQRPDFDLEFLHVLGRDPHHRIGLRHNEEGDRLQVGDADAVEVGAHDGIADGRDLARRRLLGSVKPDLGMGAQEAVLAGEPDESARRRACGAVSDQSRETILADEPADLDAGGDRSSVALQNDGRSVLLRFSD